MGSKVRDYNIPGMPFRVHQFGTPVPSLRSSQPREHLLFDSLLSLLPSRFVPRRRFRSTYEARKNGVPGLVGEGEAGRSFPGRISYPGIGKRFIFPALFSPAVRYSSRGYFIPRMHALLRVSFRFFVNHPSEGCERESFAKENSRSKSGLSAQEPR